ncbi:hypothetical protein BofuT4_uP005430.1 [Botrytis cinerea T4]|uniref:Uncharacterized protein n=1 Tax=Botryotinia fuckeliana (strain T4) TaxID=999810 RepID=G2Y3Z4_BOTF4|nr:hypothetical protein BofuT4_uP005430.1 [Botrytis cinerea T4]
MYRLGELSLLLQTMRRFTEVFIDVDLLTCGQIAISVNPIRNLRLKLRARNPCTYLGNSFLKETCISCCKKY